MSKPLIKSEKSIAGIAVGSISKTKLPVEAHLGTDEARGEINLAILSGKRMRSQSNAESVIRENFPTKGWVKDFIEYGRGVTDACPEYLFFTGLTVYGAALGRNVFLRWGNRNIYPNLYDLFTGRSTEPRKSTSAQIGIDMLIEVLPDRISPDEFTPEAFRDCLAAEPCQLVYIDEFGDLLRSMDRKDYMSGLKGALTKLYDCPPSYDFRTMGKGRKRIPNPFVSIIATSALSWLKDKLNEKDFSAGFWSRWIIVPEFKKERWYAIPPAPDLVMRQKLIDGLRVASTTIGEVILSAEATERYTIWLMIHENSILDDPNEDKLASMYGRLSINLLKIAMLYEVSQSSMEITLETTEKAINVVDCLKEKVKGVIETEFTFSRAMADKQRALSLIAKTPGISNRELLRTTKLLLKDLKPIIDTLKEEESIVERKKGKSTCYYPK